MRIRINELESLVEIHINREEHERQLRLKIESERDEWLQQELQCARKEISNKLITAHKEELETLKKRFKIVVNQASSNMERSSSEQNLEKNKVNILLVAIIKQ